MGMLHLPTELVECILVLSDFRQILKCRRLCQSMRNIIDGSALLTYHIDLAISGLTDCHLHQQASIEVRRRVLDASMAVWKQDSPPKLAETLRVVHMGYVPLQDGVVIRKTGTAFSDDEGIHSFDISLLSNSVSPRHVLSHWRIQLFDDIGYIACVDPVQDLLVCRFHEPTGSTLDPSGEERYSLAVYSLRTGKPHPEACKHDFGFTLSRRAASNSRYTRVHILEENIAVNMSSGFQAFIETMFFDWKTGKLKASFTSPGTSARSWGRPAIMLSDRCFLQSCWSAAERKPAIELYGFDADGRSDSAVHIATYWLPRTKNGELGLSLNLTSRQCTSLGSSLLQSSVYGRVLHVQITGTAFTSAFKGAFFTPIYPFLEKVDRYFALGAEYRRRKDPDTIPWSCWGNILTRWIETDGPGWQEHAKTNAKGSGSRYVFHNHLVDFAPLELAREVHRHRLSGSQENSFPSDTFGWTVHCHATPKERIPGANIFAEDITSCLPYRQRNLRGFLEDESDLDILLVGDKIVTIEGGAHDTVKIYTLAQDNVDSELSIENENDQ